MVVCACGRDVVPQLRHAPINSNGQGPTQISDDITRGTERGTLTSYLPLTLN
jgi:hypothetical protein